MTDTYKTGLLRLQNQLRRKKKEEDRPNINIKLSAFIVYNISVYT